MNKIDRRSALGIGLAAASAAMVKPAAAQTTATRIRRRGQVSWCSSHNVICLKDKDSIRGQIAFGKLPTAAIGGRQRKSAILTGLRVDRARAPAGKYFQGEVSRASAHQLERVHVATHDSPAQVSIGRSINRSAGDLSESLHNLGGEK